MFTKTPQVSPAFTEYFHYAVTQGKRSDAVVEQVLKSIQAQREDVVEEVLEAIHAQLFFCHRHLADVCVAPLRKDRAADRARGVPVHLLRQVASNNGSLQHSSSHKESRHL